MATDFFDRQDQARRQTSWLVAYFVLAVALIILTVYAAFTAILLGSQKHPAPGQALDWFDPVRLSGVAIVTGLVILLGSLYKIVALREGGAAVARALGGRLVEGNTRDLAERRLLNVVEEMALASGTPVPPVYIMDDEPGINAFAAGHSPADAVVGVTAGTLHHLNRDQLQGVVAHEFSHILNGDMRLDLKLMGVLHGILLLALLGQILMRMTSNSGSSRSRDDDKKDSGMAFFLMGLALFAIGYIGVFFGRLIKAAVSRQREFLADASAVQFTRNPEGIAGALKKIGGLSEGGRIRIASAEEACHMFFGAAVPSMTSLLATHPPLAERVKRLDPTFDGVFPEVPEDEHVELADSRKPGEPRDERGIGGLGHVLPGVNIPGGLGGAVVMAPAMAVESVGSPRPEHVAYASDLLANVPGPISRALRDPYGASAVVYGMLLDSKAAVRSAQLEHLARYAAPGLAEEAAGIAPILATIRPEMRVNLVDMAIPSLRLLSDAQYRQFRDNIGPLIGADGKIDLFEFALQHMLFRHLDRQFVPTPPVSTRYRSLSQLADRSAVLLSSLAWVGHDDPADVHHAFAAGRSALGADGASLTLVPSESCPLTKVDEALNDFAAAVPQVKRRILGACAATIAADGRVTSQEGELLRAIADSLDCPMPPLLPPATAGRSS